MIQYALKCDNDHTFDSWFQSASAFDKLKSAGMIICETCGSSHINKAIMAPNVAPSRKQVTLAPKAEETPVAEMQKTVEANSEYVGQNFAKEARSMHLGETQERSIYGEAKIEDAKKLIDDGIPVVPLPFVPKRKKN